MRLLAWTEIAGSICRARGRPRKPFGQFLAAVNGWAEFYPVYFDRPIAEM